MTAPLPPLSIYVHLPWCVRKCPYCDFNSHPVPEHFPQTAYIDALLEDLDLDRAALGDRPIVSIFFGGGTPSLFAPAQIRRFLDEVRARVTLTSDVEITLEANPGTIEHGRFSGYRDAGVNRISLGVQSFNAEHLHVLGRIHGADDVRGAVAEVRAAGFENFNLDLMFGLPGQTIEEAIADLDMAFALAPTHLSYYQLTLEPGTVFYHRPPALPDAEVIWSMQEQGQARLAHAGYEQYEISAYARPGFRCRHNLNYWRFGDYLGLGAGAHGKVTSFDGQLTITRTQRSKQPREYLTREPADRCEMTSVPAAERPFEFMLNALRLNDGFSEALFEAHTGLRFADLRRIVDDAGARGLVHFENTTWRATPLGSRFLNDLQALFLADG